MNNSIKTMSGKANYNMKKKKGRDPGDKSDLKEMIIQENVMLKRILTRQKRKKTINHNTI